MANYKNYPEYEQFYNEIQRKIDVIKPIIKEYEELQEEVSNMEGYEEVESYIQELNNVYDELNDAYNEMTKYQSSLVFNSNQTYERV